MQVSASAISMVAVLASVHAFLLLCDTQERVSKLAVRPRLCVRAPLTRARAPSSRLLPVFASNSMRPIRRHPSAGTHPPMLPWPAAVQRRARTEVAAGDCADRLQQLLMILDEQQMGGHAAGAFVGGTRSWRLLRGR